MAAFAHQGKPTIRCRYKQKAGFRIGNRRSIADNMSESALAEMPNLVFTKKFHHFTITYIVIL